MLRFPSPGGNLLQLLPFCLSGEWFWCGLGSWQGFGVEEWVCSYRPVSALHVTSSNTLGILPRCGVSDICSASLGLRVLLSFPS